MNRIAQQAARIVVVAVIEEIVGDKRRRHISPDYALRSEIAKGFGAAMSGAIRKLVDEGQLKEALAGVNRIEAYSIQETE